MTETMKTQQLLILLLALVLSACAPAQTTPAVNLTEVQNTAIAIVGKDVALTQTALPTATLEATPTFAPATHTPIPAHLVTIVPTLNPTQAALEEEIKSVIEAYFEIRYQALRVGKTRWFPAGGLWRPGI